MRTYKDVTFVGDSRAIREVLARVDAIAAIPGNTNILITGETGTGKELVARAIHHASQAQGHLVVFDATRTELFEARFFGYREGAYTGAKSSDRGDALSADNGTLFIDEIARLPRENQSKLLRFAQDRMVRGLGWKEEVPSNCRLVVATNQDLSKLVRTGEFAGDLYERLKRATINLPPLRERKEDLPALLEYSLAKTNADCGTNFEGFEYEAFDVLSAYHWPRNVREFQNVIASAVFESLLRGRKDGKIKKEDLLLESELKKWYYGTTGVPSNGNGSQKIILRDKKEYDPNGWYARGFLAINPARLAGRSQQYDKILQLEQDGKLLTTGTKIGQRLLIYIAKGMSLGKDQPSTQLAEWYARAESQDNPLTRIAREPFAIYSLTGLSQIPGVAQRGLKHQITSAITTGDVVPVPYENNWYAVPLRTSNAFISSGKSADELRRDILNKYAAFLSWTPPNGKH